MKPYTLTISANEQSKVYEALQAGLWFAKQSGTIGSAARVEQIQAAISIMNRAPAGGYETEAERSAAHTEKAIAQANAYGNN